MRPTRHGQGGAGFLANLKTNPTISYSIKLYLFLQLKKGVGSVGLKSFRWKWSIWNFGH